MYECIGVLFCLVVSVVDILAGSTVGAFAFVSCVVDVEVSNVAFGCGSIGTDGVW